jgi:glyoxylase-like metal-dependent hydrolase (beta-lactamase superfamily II)
MPTAIADRWYETRRYGDDVTLILESHIDPAWRCNIWHVRGRDTDMLVDSGMGLRPIQAEVALVTEKPLNCVATHSHFDHVGGHHEFSERIVHAAEADILTHPTRYNTVADSYVTTSDWFRQLPYADFDPNSYCVNPAPPTRVVEEGDIVDLGDRHFEVLHMPGHSPGSIALWEQRTKTLFSGDIMYDGELFDHLYHSNIDHYARSLERLRNIPVETIHAGHFDSFGRDRLIALIDAYLEQHRLASSDVGSTR